MMGIARATETITLNGNQVPYRKGEYYYTNLVVNNASVAQWQQLSVADGGRSPTNGYVYLPKTQEILNYDTDGNLTNDGRWSYVWDAENRLVRMEPSGTVTVPDGAKRKIEFAYDPQGRRIQKAVCAWVSSAWSIILSNRFVYDGWNVATELNATNNNVIRSYMWGLDLSGSLQGAGGVGGLLAIYDAMDWNNQASTHFVAYDGNGNVGGLVSAADGTVTARYEYGPFDEVIRATGPMAKANPFRFSTKYQDDETDLLYFGYRHYNASTGRWISKDPIGEKGGLNAYSFVGNEPLRRIDAKGQFPIIIPVLIGALLLEGCSSGCTCEGATLEVERTFSAGVEPLQKKPGLFLMNIGLKIEGSITVKGNKDLCKWKYYDQGSITSTFNLLRKVQPFDSSVAKAEGGPDTPLKDRPGIGETPTDIVVDGYEVPFSINYSGFSSRLDCIGSNGKVQKSATSKLPPGQLNGIATYHTSPASITVTGPQ